ncbi:hypothetical protein QYE77_04185 [Thermanaerothrix sp. 4228-RoL]|uniref:Glycosyltransferase RgtA/B/C/D-like domain-containing protein n=1 Tax=Thermanaerothrix solaris TaxID=3058434 RepID=A0ABU3NKT6_9CHLR|nr:hypothetical protein [Thermanaerothrix sp. 4228-RoL]MDT8897455.1 hypothetical protein [Thermanaerothrix sp. 4228-RoL]
MSTIPADQPWHQTLKWEQGVFLIALLLGGILRFVGLDLHPLSDTEARVALQAYALAQGQSVPDWVGQPGYLIPTAVAFFLVGAHEATARFWPAVWGLLVIILPWLLRNRLGRPLAIFLALGLALDAGLVATSRLAAADSLALLGVMGFITFFWRGEWYLAGVALALGVLSGPSFWVGILILLLTWWLWRWVNGSWQNGLTLDPQKREEGHSVSWKKVGLAFLVTLVAVGSGLGAFWRGLGAAATGLAEFLHGWSSEGVSLGLMGMGLIIYQPLGWFLALLQWLRGWRRMPALAQVATLWLGIGLLVLVVYPGRQISHLVWLLVPVWMLAASTLAQTIEHLAQTDWIKQVVVAAGYFTLVGYLWMNIEGFVPGNLMPQWVWVRWLAILGVILLGIAIGLVVSWTWGLHVARQGLFLGGFVFLSFLTFSATWQAAGLGRAPSAQVWGPQPYPAEADLLVKTLGDVSEWTTGRRDAIDIRVVGVDSPALRWTLRHFNNAQFVPVLTPMETPSVIITPETAMPGVSALYRGQDFVWRETPSWSLFLPGEWLSWIIYRKAPLQRQGVIVWVRTDRFPQVLSLASP